QNGEYARQHDRAPDGAAPRFWLGGGAVRRWIEPGAGAAQRAVAGGRSDVRRRGRRRAGFRGDAARREEAPFAERRLAGGGDGGGSRSGARWTARLCRGPSRGSMDRW